MCMTMDGSVTPCKLNPLRSKVYVSLLMEFYMFKNLSWNWLDIAYQVASEAEKLLEIYTPELLHW